MDPPVLFAPLSVQHNTHNLHITQPQSEKNRYYTEREFEKQNYFYSLCNFTYSRSWT